MTQIFFFSGSGNSASIAQYFATALQADMQRIPCENLPACDIAIVVFPVYCQNIPTPVVEFLKKQQANHVVLIATYGKISYGNVLAEAAKLVSGTVIAGAYVPMAHSFLQEENDFDFRLLEPILQRIAAPKPVHLPKCAKNPFSDFLPEWRSRVGLKICKHPSCTNCGLCDAMCPVGAMRNGIPTQRCMRCLRCVTNCPAHALYIQPTSLLRAYLSRKRKSDFLLYL